MIQRGTRYFLTEDGSAGVKVEAPTSAKAFDRLLTALRKAYPTLREVSQEEYRANECINDIREMHPGGIQTEEPNDPV